MIGIKEEIRQEIRDIDIEGITVKIVDNIPRWDYAGIENFITELQRLWSKDRKPLCFSISSFVRKFGNYGNKDAPRKDATKMVIDITEAMGFLSTVISDVNYIYVSF